MGKGHIEARTVLWYLTFIGFAVNYMIRININITIVDMVQQKRITNNTIKSECFINDNNNNNLSSFNIINNLNTDSNNSDNNDLLTNLQHKPFQSMEKEFLNKIGIEYEKNGFKWNEYDQGLILGAFYWLHWLTQVPGGVLARKYGTKLVFGLSNLIGCWLCIFMPLAAYWDYRILIFLRVLQGLICGLSWPAMHNMTAQWIPPNERSKFVTAYLGSSIGVALNFPLFGFIISWTSWEWVFHFCGIIGTVWYIGWYFFVFDSPALHPRIHPKEREYIEKSLATSLQRVKVSTPWIEILKAKALWMNVIAQWGGIWGLFTLMTQAPTYFKYIHGWGIQMTGVLSGLPHLMRMVFAYCFSIFGDYLLRQNKMSRTNVRKLATTICCILNGIFVLGLAFSGCNGVVAVVFLTLATAVHGAVSTGPLASVVDLSPNYAGILLGISGMIGVLPGFISPIIVGILTLGNQTIRQWKFVFLTTAGMLIGSGILYVLFAESNLQKWNNPHESSGTEKELQELRANNKEFVNKNRKSENDEEDQ